MIRRVVRLTYRLNRFEVIAVAVLGAIIVLGALFVTWRLGSTGLTADCLPSFETGEVPANCAPNFQTFQEIAGVQGGLVLTLAAFFPVLGGLLLGGPSMAREIERGTARLAWSLSASRVRWFVHRVVPVLVFLMVVGYAVGVAIDLLTGAIRVGQDLSNSFASFRLRGLMVATTGLLIAATGMALGAILGRSVPTFLLSFILGSLLVYGGVANVHRMVLLGEAEQRPADMMVFDEGDLYIDTRFRLADGRLVTYEELDPGSDGFVEFDGSIPQVSLVIPGQRYRELEMREALAHLAIAGLFVLWAAFAIVRRRPS